MAPPSTSNLKQLVEYQSKSERFEMFDGQGQLVLTVARFAIKLLSEDDKIIESLKSLEESAMVSWSYSYHSQQDRKFSESFWNFVERLQVFFKVPNIRNIAEPNELIAAFIDLLLEIIQEILNLQPYFINPIEDSMQTLKAELKFLVTFLGDTPSQPIELEPTKKTLAAIEGVANEVGIFLYSFFFSKKRISMIEMKQKLNGLLGEVEKLKERIKDQCVTIAKMLPNWVAPKTAVVSPALVDYVMDYLTDPMNHKDERIIDLIDQTRTIQKELMFLQSILGNLDVQRHSEFEEFWAQIGDVAYEVEYILESFSTGWEWYLNLRIPSITKKIQLIKMSIQERNVENYVAEISASRAALAPAKKVTVSEDTFVGFRNEVREIKWLLLSERLDLEVICIYGMPGIGKTTVAKKIYNGRLISRHFDKLAWCSIPETCQTRNVLIDLLSCVSHIHRLTMLTMDDDNLAMKIYKSLKGYRYLIVIDNIWNVNVWDDIRRVIPNDNVGSRILLTSQNKDMGLMVSRSILISLPLLTDEEAWNLLHLKVFHEDFCAPELADVAKKIVKNCQGLPLIVVKIALVLANIPKKASLWMDVANNISSHIWNGIDEFMNSIDESMKHVYNYLPMHLRPCFLYFGAFEGGMEIPVQKLLILWDAEGFIGKEEHKSSQDLAEEYLMDLVSRNLVLVAKRRSNGRVKSCTIQPIIYDMCLRIAQKENFVKVIKDHLSIYEQHHILSIHSHSIPSLSRPFGLHIRSLLGNLPDPSAFMFGSLKRVKVLNLPSTDLSLYDLKGSEFFGVLKFLSVSSIPPSIEIFRNLEFLFVDNKEVVEIPVILLKMVKLKHVHFSGSAQFSKSWHLEVTHDEILQKSYLLNISSLFINDENDEKILRLFPHLRTLKGRCTVFWDSFKKCYRFPALNFLERLESLNISFRPSYASNDSIHEFMSLPSNLKKLTLRNFDLSRKHMKAIAELPNLEVLKLRDDTIEGKQWDTSEDEFINLRYLELDAVQIKYWNASQDCFPVLEQLLLVRCQLLKEIPSDFGCILTLQKIEVHGCRTTVAASAYQIQEEQGEYGNEWLQVIVSYF